VEDSSEEFSKTQRKRQMLELQSVGERLIELTEAQLAELDLPERLLDAVLAAKRINKFGALRRQTQYIGRLMRDVDSEPILKRLEAWQGSSREATAYLHLLERWRERLLADDAALSELAGAYSGCDTQRLRTLIRNARKERDEAAAPRSARALFQALKEIIPASG
jgi:ribosome-associated protein